MNEAADKLLFVLQRAVKDGRSEQYCFRLWSNFIKARDGSRCVLCEGNSYLAAHHIVRKCFLRIARFDSGNGITLCRSCHAEPHLSFNRRPDMFQPMDAEGGENIDLMTYLYRALAEDAIERGLRRDDYYFLSEDVLRTFKRFQELPATLRFLGTPVEQAYWIWRQTPRSSWLAIMKANGVSVPHNFFNTIRSRGGSS